VWTPRVSAAVAKGPYPLGVSTAELRVEPPSDTATEPVAPVGRDPGPVTCTAVAAGVTRRTGGLLWPGWIGPEPPTTAVTWCIPVASVRTVWAAPDLTGAVTTGVSPSTNVTVPEDALPEPGDADVACAVSVTLCPPTGAGTDDARVTDPEALVKVAR
jgi:hypothetical protein